MQYFRLRRNFWNAKGKYTEENVLVVLFGASKHHRVVYEPNLNFLEKKYSCPYCPVKVDTFETRAEIDSDDPVAFQVIQVILCDDDYNLFAN